MNHRSLQIRFTIVPCKCWPSRELQESAIKLTSGDNYFALVIVLSIKTFIFVSILENLRDRFYSLYLTDEKIEAMRGYVILPCLPSYYVIEPGFATSKLGSTVRVLIYSFQVYSWEIVKSVFESREFLSRAHV